MRQTALLQPITVNEQRAISAFALMGRRLVDCQPMISTGLNEKIAKDEGVIVRKGAAPGDWAEVILQGPHFGVATPFAKQPNIPCRSNKDYEAWDLANLDVNAVPRTNYCRAVERSVYRQVQDKWNGLPCTDYYRLVWREMVPLTTERSLFASIAPPGPAHIHAVRSMALGSSRETALHSAFWASLPLDYLLRITGRSHLDVNNAGMMPAPDPGHPLAAAALLRTLRLNCLTRAYAPLWDELYDARWSGEEDWAVAWSALPEAQHLGALDHTWTPETPLRSERARRSALVELDALVAVWLGIGEEELLSMYAARFPVLYEYESAMWFDSCGRKITRDYYARGFNQAGDAYEQLMSHLENPTTTPPPEGYKAPFYKADREGEYRQAHAVFNRRLQEAIAVGWSPS